MVFFFFYLGTMQPHIKILRRNWKLELSDSRAAKKGRQLTANWGKKNDILIGNLDNITKFTLGVMRLLTVLTLKLKVGYRTSETTDKMFHSILENISVDKWLLIWEKGNRKKISASIISMPKNYQESCLLIWP